MPACQISFSAFALAAQQAVTVCTPPVLESATAVVTHPLAVDGGECSCHVFRRISRLNAVLEARAGNPSPWGVELGGVVVRYPRRSFAFNNAVRFGGKLVEILS